MRLSILRSQDAEWRVSVLPGENRALQSPVVSMRPLTGIVLRYPEKPKRTGKLNNRLIPPCNSVIPMEAVVVAKKWGKSYGVFLPREIVKAENIRENEKIVIDVKKRQLGSALMGILSDWRKKPQTIKDEARRGWG